jgi:hypothetical protein
VNSHFRNLGIQTSGNGKTENRGNACIAPSQIAKADITLSWTVFSTFRYFGTRVFERLGVRRHGVPTRKIVKHETPKHERGVGLEQRRALKVERMHRF